MSAVSYQRSAVRKTLSRLREPRRFIQVLSGPRQVGKTTLAQQIMRSFRGASHYASADMLTSQTTAWIEHQWELGRNKLRRSQRKGLLVLDEVTKVPQWSSVVKAQWDMDSRNRFKLQVLLLGSSPLLLQRGLSESLAGRFEVIPVTHWSLREMKKAFGWNVEKYLLFGGYPGAASLIADPNRWSQYILESLVETTLSRDILLLTRVDKPALLRHLFHLACAYSGQILSYQKMVGQLQDAGNTTTLAHYLDLLYGSGFVRGLSKFSGAKVRQRGSSPKLQVLNNALLTAVSGIKRGDVDEDPELRGRLVESAIGAHLSNEVWAKGGELFYWLDRNREVDFVLRYKGKVLAIEVKSGRSPYYLPGLEAFRDAYPASKPLLVGGDGVGIEDFLESTIDDWV